MSTCMCCKQSASIKIFLMAKKKGTRGVELENHRYAIAHRQQVKRRRYRSYPGTKRLIPHATKEHLVERFQARSCERPLCVSPGDTRHPTEEPTPTGVQTHLKFASTNRRDTCRALTSDDKLLMSTPVTGRDSNTQANIIFVIFNGPGRYVSKVGEKDH